MVLSAGAINSPQILQCSGIGDPEQLKAAGVETRHAFNGVGKNLQDHLQIRLVFKTNKRPLNDELNNPLTYPQIHPNYLSDGRDCAVALGGIKVARRIAEAPSLRDCIVDE